MNNDLNDEIRQHLEENIADLMERGLSASDARSQALREFGNPALHLENSRAVWRWPSLDRLWQDLRYALRTLRRNAGFAAVVILTLALGIGANTAIFSAVNTVLIQPLPYPAPDRLVWIATHGPDSAGYEGAMGPDYFDWREQAESFDAMMAYEEADQTMAANTGAYQAHTASVSGDFWAITGARPILGQAFTADERNAVVLSHAFFERRFAGDPRIIGRSVTLDGEPATIVGVMPADFRFFFPRRGVFATPGNVEAFVASSISPANQQRDAAEPCKNAKPGAICLRIGTAVSVVARLKPGVSVENARTEMQAVEARLVTKWPKVGEYKRGLTLRLLPVRDKLVEASRPALLVLLGAVGFVLLIACANVANLLLARVTARHREISIRIALGAGRWRVARQLLTESLVLSLLGGAAGLLLAHWAIQLLARFGPSDVPRLHDISIDARVLLFTLAASVVTGILFGTGPALSFKTSGRPTAKGPNSGLMRGSLAACEIALALILLTGAGLMVKSLWLMNQRTPGFNPERILVMKVALSGPRYQSLEQRIAYYDEILRRLNAVPGVESAALGNLGSQLLITPPAGAPGLPDGIAFGVNTASQGYMRAIGLHLLEGRWITDDESTRVMVVNQTYARIISPGEDPIGKSAFGSSIVGVVADLKYSKLDENLRPEEYSPYRQAIVLYDVNLVVRTARDPLTLAPELRKLVSQIDTTQPVYDVQTLDQSLAASIAPRRFNMLLLAIFAGIAVLLAAVGIYGIMSYAVTQRTQEIGVRIALGARQSEVIGMVVKQGMLVALCGVLAGLGCALWLTRLMASLLYNVQPWDAPTFTAVCLSLSLAALAACWIPARRAARVDPVTALRYD
jgi:putative ABC transport system permease protein